MINQIDGGAAIQIQNEYDENDDENDFYGTLTLTNTVFSNNLALNGGSIYIFSESINGIKANFTNVTFEQSHALSTGGAIYYDSFADFSLI